MEQLGLAAEAAIMIDFVHSKVALMRNGLCSSTFLQATWSEYGTATQWSTVNQPVAGVVTAAG